jgi:hypothetical protein
MIENAKSAVIDLAKRNAEYFILYGNHIKRSKAYFSDKSINISHHRIHDCVTQTIFHQN